jgi:hypothetical protein
MMITFLPFYNDVITIKYPLLGNLEKIKMQILCFICQQCKEKYLKFLS